MSIRDKLAHIAEERSEKEWAARESGAREVGERATQFLEPGEQLQVAVPGELTVPPPSTAGAMAGRFAVNVVVGLLDSSGGFNSDYDSGVEVVIAVTDRAIVVIRSDDEPSHGTYGRYPRNMYFPVKAGGPFQEFLLGHSKLNAPSRSDHDWGRWEDVPPSEQFHYGRVETALGNANAVLDTMIANKVFDAPVNAPQAQQQPKVPYQGWYPDPAGAPESRYWDGLQWDLRYWDGRRPDRTAQPPAQ